MTRLVALLALALLAACNTPQAAPAAPASDPTRAWAAALAEIVNADGSFDADRLATHRPTLQAWIGWTNAQARPRAARELRAWWLNLYTALALEEVMLDGLPPERIDPLGDPRAGRFGYSGWKAWQLQPRATTLFEIAHERAREFPSDPRAHGALPGLVRSGAPLSGRLWSGRTLDQQLDAQMRAWLADPVRGLRVDAEGVHLSAALTRWERDLRWWTGGKDLCAFASVFLPLAQREALTAASEAGCAYHTLPWDSRLDHRAFDGGRALPELPDDAPRDTGRR